MNQSNVPSIVVLSGDAPVMGDGQEASNQSPFPPAVNAFSSAENLSSANQDAVTGTLAGATLVAPLSHFSRKDAYAPLTLRRCKDRYTAMCNFIASVEAGSLAKASESIGLSPSAISVSISRLERVVGVKLLARTTRTMALTHSGHIFYERAKQAVEMTQAAFGLADAIGSNEKANDA